MKKILILFLCIFSLFTIVSTNSIKASPSLMNAQGRIALINGDSLVSGNYQITFSIYDAEIEGNIIWNESYQELGIKNGQFNVLLGSINPIVDSVFASDNRWLGVQVFGESEMTPRSRLVTVPYSQRVNTVDGAEGGTLQGPITVSRYAPEDNNPAFKVTHHSNHAHPNQTAFEVVGGVTDVAPKRFKLFTSGDDPWKFHALLEGDLQIGEKPLGNGIGTTVLSAHRLDFRTSYGVTHGKVGIDVFGDYNNNILDVQPSVSMTFDRQNIDDYWNGRPFSFDISQFGQTKFHITSQGAVGINTNSPTAELDVNGTTKTKILEITGGADLAEPFEITNNQILEPGSVVVIDKNNSGRLTLTSFPYDKKVAGVISGAGGITPGLTLKQEGVMDGSQNVALTGRVYVLATTNNGVIRPGDRLTTSSISGYCMKATDNNKCDGSVLGKAMSSLDESTGLVLVLVNLQ